LHELQQQPGDNVQVFRRAADDVDRILAPPVKVIQDVLGDQRAIALAPPEGAEQLDRCLRQPRIIYLDAFLGGRDNLHIFIFIFFLIQKQTEW